MEKEQTKGISRFLDHGANIAGFIDSSSGYKLFFFLVLASFTAIASLGHLDTDYQLCVFIKAIIFISFCSFILYLKKELPDAKEEKANNTSDTLKKIGKTEYKDYTKKYDLDENN